MRDPKGNVGHNTGGILDGLDTSSDAFDKLIADGTTSKLDLTSARYTIRIMRLC